jgi:hypothetical protein
MKQEVVDGAAPGSLTSLAPAARAFLRRLAPTPSTTAPIPQPITADTPSVSASVPSAPAAAPASPGLAALSASGRPLHPALAARMAAKQAAAAATTPSPSSPSAQPGVGVGAGVAAGAGAGPGAAQAASVAGQISAVPPAHVGRIAVSSLGGFGWSLEPAGSSNNKNNVQMHMHVQGQVEAELYRAVHGLKAAVAGTRSCAVVTVPAREFCFSRNPLLHNVSTYLSGLGPRSSGLFLYVCEPSLTPVGFLRPMLPYLPPLQASCPPLCAPACSTCVTALCLSSL